MSTLLTVGLIVCGFLTAGCVWTIKLKISVKHGRLIRIGSVAGILMQWGVFIYSIYFIKGAEYAWYLILGLSLVSTLVWFLVCGLVVGVIILVWIILHFKFTI